MISTKPLRIILCGALGRMGRRVADLAGKDRRFQIVAGVVRELSAAERESVGVPLIKTQDLAHYLSRADALIDFSTPEASLDFAAAAARARKALVSGTPDFPPASSRGSRASRKRRPYFSRRILAWG